MQSIFDFSFFPSSRLGSKDNWIGQQHTLSYLNSSSIPSFIFRYLPFEIEDGRIDSPITYAELVPQDSDRKLLANTVYGETNPFKDGFFLKKQALSFKRELEQQAIIREQLFANRIQMFREAFATPAFMYQLKEIAITILTVKFFDRKDNLQEGTELTGTIVHRDEFLNKYVNPIVEKYIHASRREMMKGHLLNIYDNRNLLGTMIPFLKDSIALGTVVMEYIDEYRKATLTGLYENGERPLEEHIGIQASYLDVGFREDQSKKIPNTIFDYSLSIKPLPHETTITNLMVATEEAPYISTVPNLFQIGNSEIVKVGGSILTTLTKAYVETEGTIYESEQALRINDIKDGIVNAIVEISKKDSLYDSLIDAKDIVSTLMLDESYLSSNYLGVQLLENTAMISSSFQLTNIIQMDSIATVLSETKTDLCSVDGATIADFIYISIHPLDSDINKNFIFTSIVPLDSIKDTHTIRIVKDFRDTVFESSKLFTELASLDGMSTSSIIFVTKVPKNSREEQVLIDTLFMSKNLKDVGIWNETVYTVKNQTKLSFVVDEIMRFEKADTKFAKIDSSHITFIDEKLKKPSSYSNHTNFMELVPINTKMTPVIQDTIFMELSPLPSRYREYIEYLNLRELDTNEIENIYKKGQLIELESGILSRLIGMTPEQLKTTIDTLVIKGVLDSLDAGGFIAQYINANPIPKEIVIEELISANPSERNGLELSNILGNKDDYHSKILEHILADKPTASGILLSTILSIWDPQTFGLVHDLPIFADVPLYGINVANMVFGEQPDNHSIVSELQFAPEPENIGSIVEYVNANEHTIREAHVENRPTLVQDKSEWDEIWDRYSPGQDFLDPPDSDFDYSSLSNQVYDETTGVPYAPIGATNKPNVFIQTPLHHPIPNHADVGVDETKRIIVDNYIFIDTTLAIDALKTRNTLRYAGMPAAKTIQDLFSKLFTWIQPIADPSSDEFKQYQRMFRFARWYAERAILKHSKHVLERIYDRWLSEMHVGNELGIPYTAVNWPYIAAAQIFQSSDTYASMKFEKENYIDGEITIRGFLENPLNQVTMIVKIDEVTVDTFTGNGAFSKTYPVPQGNHNYEIILIVNGTTGRALLSTIEISGCNFISATTVSDDSDVNGLKAITTLINMLLSYFEYHHGDGKVKGTMEIKQRKVWQST